MALCQVFKLWSLNQYNLKEVMGAFDVNALHTTHQDTMCFLSFFVCSTEEPSIPFMVRPPTNGLCSQLFVVFLLVSFLLDSIWYLSSYHLLLCHVHSLLIPFSTGLSPSFLSVCMHALCRWPWLLCIVCSKIQSYLITQCALGMLCNGT